MHRIQLDKDIQPLSEFRSKLTYYLDKVKKTKRPLIITQNGKSSAVLLEVSEYQSLIDRLEILEDVKLAEEQLSKEEGISHNDVKKKFIKKF